MPDSSLTSLEVAAGRDGFLCDLELALLESFGVRFDLWMADGTWLRVPTSVMAMPKLRSPDELGDEVGQYLAKWRGEESFRTPLLMDDDGDCLILLPVSVIGRSPLMAISRYGEPRSELLERLARSFVREFTFRQRQDLLRQELRAYAHQVTDDLEELTLLRSLAQWLEMADVSQDRWHMARCSLPMLCQTIKAEALALLPAESSDGAEPAATAGVLPPAAWVGPSRLDDLQAVALVERFRHAAQEHAVVNNHFRADDPVRQFPGVREFILVPIAKDGWQVGWLLAVNCRHHEGTLDGDLVGPNQFSARPPWGLSDLEFGSVEASLMTSAAAVYAAHARNQSLFHEKEALLVGTVRALVSAVEARDRYTYGHSERVALVARRIAREMGLDANYCHRIYVTGLLHDVGKVGISDRVLNKSGNLTAEELEEVKRHPELGYKILKDLSALAFAFPGVLHHHESFDGGGYPDRLCGEQIPLEARILAVADAFDAMSSDRPYRHRLEAERVEAILASGAGTQWDSQVIAALFDALDDIRALAREYRPAVQEVWNCTDDALAIAVSS